MRNAFKSIKRMKFMAFLIVFQLAISFMLLNSSSEVLESQKNKLNGFKKVINYQKTYLIRPFDTNYDKKQLLDEQNGTFFFSFNMDDKIYYLQNGFMDNLNELKENGLIDNIFIYSPYANVLTPELLNDNVSMKKNLDGLLVNYDFIDNYKLPVVEGRNFTKKDFDIDYKKDPIPIIIGQDFNEKIKVGDIIDYKSGGTNYSFSNEVGDYEKIDTTKWLDNNGVIKMTDVNLKFEIIGFYDNNAIPVIRSKSTGFIDQVNFSNSYTIVPCVRNFSNLNEGVAIYDLGVYIETSDIELISAKMKNDLQENDFDEIRKLDFKEEHSKFYEVMSRNVLKSSLLPIVLMLLSVIAITSVLLGELKDRKKEFGVRIACGATVKNLCKEMFIEIVILLSLSSIISLLNALLSKTLSLNIALINIGVMGIITLIISIIPIMRLRKMNPVDLVRGK